ncbi:hypothetical protein JC796_25950 [Delftia acidovorans]|uniref:hypothetical protein n=1 Tax=Delftia acidovorans TaxID=80866 RepID=UPI0018E8156F|nr:hypothetical protein [Delftia acidovorans]MBJ2144199.1 hypothetical protein [Delftia acidovorans]
MAEQQTPGYGLPLPAPDNQLEQDVLRLVAAFQQLDGELQRIDLAVAARAIATEMQASLQAVQQGIAQLTTGKVASVNGVAGVAITLKPEHLALGPANGPTQTTITYDGAGRVSSIVETRDGQPATTTMAYNGDGTVASVTTLYRGRTRTETYAYAGGKVSGISATEVQV